MSASGKTETFGPRQGQVRSSPDSGHAGLDAAGPFRAKGGSLQLLFDHLVASCGQLGCVVNRAARPSATLQRIARRLRHADKGQARLF